jgi:hypothetical protein
MEQALLELRGRPINTMDPILLELNEEYETIIRQIDANEELLESLKKNRKRKKDLDDKIDIESKIKNTNQYLEFLHTKKKELEPQLSLSLVKNAMDPTVSTSPLARLSAHGPHFRKNFQDLISQYKGPGGTRKSRKSKKSRKSRKA